MEILKITDMLTISQPKKISIVLKFGGIFSI